MISRTDGSKDGQVTEVPSRARDRRIAQVRPLRVDGAHDVAHSQSILDELHGNLLRNASEIASVHEAMEQLFLHCAAIRHQCSQSQWDQWILSARKHPICQTIHRDPFTRRAFDKPRGYAGDAVMMDYIYAAEEDFELPEACEAGRALFEFTIRSPASCGVRARRGWMADQLDSIASRRCGSDVLAVAAGHLREASMSAGVRRRRFGRFLAIDADASSLAEIDRCYGRYGITTAPVNVRGLLTGRSELGAFDVVYSTGLYDYLSQATARRLTENLFTMLRPGGRLLLANFLPQVRDIGYMETFMDWHLIYRNRVEMADLTSGIDEAEIASIKIHSEEHLNIIFLEVEKR
jgi:extracellular factor (EF) 3-hydroxypalmitic acid methyl ester biosynthesis protein